MKLLLDTHVLLWWLAGDRKLGRRAAALIGDPANAVSVSAATAWEIAIKAGLGRIELDEPPEVFLPRELQRGGFVELPVTVVHALAVRTLPRHHADPFDRLLVAQARQETMRLVTGDEIFGAYGVSTISARD